MMRRADVVCGLGFGDEGKGVVVARLTDEAVRCAGAARTAIVRFSGGPQNAHNVCWREQSKHHTFAQIGSGGSHRVVTFTAPFVPVDPIALFCEADTLLGNKHRDIEIASVCSRQFFHEDSLLILPIHERVSQLREQRLRHGSTGRGIFEVNKFAGLSPTSAPRLRDLSEPRVLIEKLCAFLAWANAGMPDEHARKIIEAGVFERVNASEEVEDFLRFCENTMAHSYQVFLGNILTQTEWLRGMGAKERLIFEGGQGVLLDSRFGFYPNVTFSHTTPLGAVHILRQLAPLFSARTHGVIRTYATRHGAGLLPREINGTHPEHLSLSEAERHNMPSLAGAMRYAPLSADLLDYAMALCELDGGHLTDIHITHRDIAPFAPVVRIAHELSGRAMANRAHALFHDDARRRRLINEWGQKLALVEGAAVPADPDLFFLTCQVHCHSSPNINAPARVEKGVYYV